MGGGRQNDFQASLPSSNLRSRLKKGEREPLAASFTKRATGFLSFSSSPFYLGERSRRRLSFLSLAPFFDARATRQRARVKYGAPSTSAKNENESPLLHSQPHFPSAGSLVFYRFFIREEGALASVVDVQSTLGAGFVYVLSRRRGEEESRLIAEGREGDSPVQRSVGERRGKMGLK